MDWGEKEEIEIRRAKKKKKNKTKKCIRYDGESTSLERQRDSWPVRVGHRIYEHDRCFALMISLSTSLWTSARPPSSPSSSLIGRGRGEEEQELLARVGIREQMTRKKVQRKQNTRSQIPRRMTPIYEPGRIYVFFSTLEFPCNEYLSWELDAFCGWKSVPCRSMHARSRIMVILYIQ